jgi:hypothetical protein
MINACTGVSFRDAADVKHAVQNAFLTILLRQQRSIAHR